MKTYIFEFADGWAERVYADCVEAAQEAAIDAVEKAGRVLYDIVKITRR